MRDDDFDLEPNELGEGLGGTVSAALRPPILDCDTATFDPVEFTQSLHESVGPFLLRRRRGRAQESDGRQFCEPRGRNGTNSLKALLYAALYRS